MEDEDQLGPEWTDAELHALVPLLECQQTEDIDIGENENMCNLKLTSEMENPKPSTSMAVHVDDINSGTQKSFLRKGKRRGAQFGVVTGEQVYQYEQHRDHWHPITINRNATKSHLPQCHVKHHAGTTCTQVACSHTGHMEVNQHKTMLKKAHPKHNVPKLSSNIKISNFKSKIACLKRIHKLNENFVRKCSKNCMCDKPSIEKTASVLRPTCPCEDTSKVLSCTFTDGYLTHKADLPSTCMENRVKNTQLTNQTKDSHPNGTCGTCSLVETQECHNQQSQPQSQLGDRDCLLGVDAGDKHVSSSLYTQLTISEMPNSLVLRIFSYLPLPDLLCRASLVCKHWSNLARDPDLWRSVKVMGFVKVDDTVLERLTSYSENVCEVDITDSRLVTDQGVAGLLKKCKRLEVFKATRCQQLSENAFDNMCGCSYLKRLHLDNLHALSDQALEKISGRCPNLTHIRLSVARHITNLGVGHLAVGCPRLESVCLNQCYGVKDGGIMKLADGCKNLAEMGCMNCDLTDASLFHMKKLKELRILDVSQVKEVTSAGVIAVVKHCPKLEVLNLGLCTQIDDSCVDSIAKYGSSIRNLHLVSCSLTDKALQSLSQCKKLRHLDVGWCREVTDLGVKKISAGAASLTFLGLIRCDRVTMATVEQLMESYPHIQYSTVYLEFKRLLAKAQEETGNYREVSQLAVNFL